MNDDISRKTFIRDFFTLFRAEVISDESGKAVVDLPILLPQGALSWEHLRENCIQCYNCISRCPHEALRVVRDADTEREGLPAIYPRLNACIDCREKVCIEACNGAALSYEYVARCDQSIVINSELCLAYKGQYCMSCVNICPYSGRAIMQDANLRPFINLSACTYCGLCINACPGPENSIKISTKEKLWQ